MNTEKQDMTAKRCLVLAVLAALTGTAHAEFDVTYRRNFEYDDAGRLIRERNAENHVVATYTYDNEDRLTAVTDALNRTKAMSYDALGRMVRSVDPLNGVSTFAYDVNDRPVTVTDPKGRTTSYEVDGFGQTWKQSSPDTGITTAEYNAAGLPTRMTRNDGRATVYQYDGMGRLIQAKAGTEERNFSYDTCTNGKTRLCVADVREDGAVKAWTAYDYSPQGWLTQQRDSGVDEGGQPYDGVVSYAYDGMGRITGVSYPSGVAVGYGYNAGLLTTMMATVDGNAHTVANNITYQPFGPANGWTYGNGLERLVNRDANGRVYGISAGTGDTLVQSLTYGHNLANEIIAITNGLDAKQNRNYQYDALGRLAMDTAKDAEWRYDANGNRTHWIEAGVPTAYTVDPASNRTLGYHHPSDSRTYDHDALGNRISETAPGRSATYVFNAFNRMSGATVNGATSTYTVNALDQRVSKSTPQGRTRFVYAGQNQMLAEHGTSGWTNYLWFGNQLVGLVKPDKQLRYVHNDHLGRPEAVTNGARQVVWRANNDAWDRTAQQDSIGGFNFGFPGQYRDAETGLWYNGFRYYDSHGGYTQSDPIGLAAGSFSTYAYADGNPVARVDPNGLLGILISGNFDASFFGPGATGSSGFFIGTGGWGFVSGAGGRAGTGAGAAASVSVGLTSASKPSDLAGTSAAAGANANIPSPFVVKVSAGASVSNICSGCKKVYSVSLGPALKPAPFEVYTSVTHTNVNYSSEDDYGDAVVIVDGEEVSREAVQIDRPAGGGGGGREGGGGTPGGGNGFIGGSGCYGNCGGGGTVVVGGVSPAGGGGGGGTVIVGDVEKQAE